MAKKYYIGDLHIGHRSMTVKRGFSDEVEMFDCIKTKWNEKGRKNDVVWILGDVVMERRRYIKKLEELNQREKKVLEMRYGLRDGKKRTQKQIARKLGISRSYVSRIEKKAVENLCNKFKH